MAQILFRLQSNSDSDPDIDRMCYKKGYPVSIKRDGWYEGNPNWSQSAYADKTQWVVVDVPDATIEELQTYIKEWKNNFDYNIISANANQGRYTVKVFEKNVSVSGLNTITLAKVEKFLTRWGCSNISTTADSVQFDFVLWNAVRSYGFWQIDFSQRPVDFSLVSYSASTGIGRIKITVPLTIDGELVRNKIIQVGGTIVSSEHPIWIFDIERNTIFQHFKRDIKEKAERRFKRRQFRLTESQADAIATAGGIVTRTKAQLASAMINGMNE